MLTSDIFVLMLFPLSPFYSCLVQNQVLSSALMLAATGTVGKHGLMCTLFPHISRAFLPRNSLLYKGGSERSKSTPGPTLLVATSSL